MTALVSANRFPTRGAARSAAKQSHDHTGRATTSAGAAGDSSRVPGGVMPPANVGQGQRRGEPRRERGGGDLADGPTVGGEQRAGCRHVAPVNPQAAERAVDVPQRVDAGHRFLAEVAAFDKADCLPVAVHFLREVFVGDIASVDGPAGLDPCGLHRRRVAGDGSDRGEPHGHVVEHVARGADQEPDRPGHIDAHGDDLVAGEANCGAGEPHRRRGRAALGCDERLALRSGEQQFTPRLAAIAERHVVAQQVLVQVGDQLARLAGHRIEHQRIFPARDEHVAERLALHRSDERLATIAGLERANLVGAEIVQERGAIPPGDFNQRPAAQIGYGGGRRQCPVLWRRFLAHACHSDCGVATAYSAQGSRMQDSKRPLSRASSRALLTGATPSSSTSS